MSRNVFIVQIMQNNHLTALTNLVRPHNGSIVASVWYATDSEKITSSLRAQTISYHAA